MKKEIYSNKNNQLPLKFINIGFGNIVNRDRILSILMTDTAPSRRLISEAKANLKLIDATAARRTKCIILMDNGYIISCGLNADTIMSRLNIEDRAETDKLQDE